MALKKERIVRAALKWNDLVFIGTGHVDCEDCAEREHGIKLHRKSGVIEGFVTSEGRFLSRAEAFSVAKMAGQLTSNHETGRLESWMLPDLPLEKFDN